MTCLVLAPGQWGTIDGPYSQGYDYDVWGNVTHKYGWGGEVQGGGAGQTTDIYYSYMGNRRNGFSYDAAGNLTNDLGQTFTYDATGQQATASYGGYSLTQNYDGDGLQVKKNDNGVDTYYLRSSVLGGQVVAEMKSVGELGREYVYLGGLLAVRDKNKVYWMHEDPITKSKRVTNNLGAVVSTIELDPWGADTTRSNNAAFQPRKFTSYERDGNGSDEAMFRRSNRWHSRFDQPDPSDGSYDLTDPQSLNRYAYVQNDPANFTDPSGLMMTWCFWEDLGEGVLLFTGCIGGGSDLPAGPRDEPNRGGGGGDKTAPTPTPTPTPCDVQAPSDPNDRAVAEALMGEATSAGSPQYGDDQRGSAAVGHASRGVVPRGAVRLEEFLMVSVIENRARARGTSWFDVVNSKQRNGNFQFEGYPQGQNYINQLGENGSDTCERLRGALDAINAVKLNGPNNRFGTFMNWRGVDQDTFIRARQGAFRIAGTDFF
jgi:RHS repeat-associated protein